MPLVKVSVCEISIATVADFRAQLASVESSDGPVGIDFSEVTFIDSTGIRALAEAAQTVRNTGQTFDVINAQSPR